MQSIVEQSWPDEIPRTPPGQRSDDTPFDVALRRTRKELKKEMERMDVDDFELYDSTASDEPGVVLIWEKDGKDYVAACDGYQHKKQNMRDLYSWVNETRMREKRETATVGENFQAARKELPSGEEEVIAVGPVDELDGEPHEILEVAPDASDQVVKSVARRKMADVKPNGDGGDREQFIKYQKAKEAMLNE